MAKDILLASDNDILIANADWVIGESLVQQKKTLFFNELAAFKQNPLATIGASDFLEAESFANLLREVRQKFNEDGITGSIAGNNSKDVAHITNN